MNTNRQTASEVSERTKEDDLYEGPDRHHHYFWYEQFPVYFCGLLSPYPTPREVMVKTKPMCPECERIRRSGTNPRPGR